MKGRTQDHRLVGAFILLLLIGAEARRVETDIEAHSYTNLTRIARKRAAVRYRAERELGTFSREGELDHSIEGLRLEADRHRSPDGDSGEVARGMLKYKGAWNVAILRPGESAGSANLELYPMGLEVLDKEFDESGPSRPHMTFVIRDDDFVGAAAKSGTHKLHLNCEVHKGIKFQTSYRGSVELTADDEDLSIKLKGNGNWLQIGRPGEVLRAWMKAIRVLQTVGTCLEDGTCLIQCTYLPQEGGCNSQEFCYQSNEADRLGKSTWTKLWFDTPTRPRCRPHVGMTANLVAWDRLQEKAIHGLEEIENNNCFVSCRERWKYVNRKSQIAISLRKQANDILRRPDAEDVLPDGMPSVLRTIQKEAPGIATEVALRLGVVFDRKRKDSAKLKQQLDKKGCSELQDGSMEAVVMAALMPDDAGATAQVRVYQEQCPILTGSGEAHQLEESAELEQALEEQSHGEGSIVNAEGSGSSLTQRQEQSRGEGSIVNAEGSGSSMTQRQEDITLVIILVLGAIALLCCIVGCFLVFSSVMCARKESFAMQHCRKTYLGHMKTNCERDGSWGIFFLIAGIVLLAIVLSLLVFTGMLGAGVTASGLTSFLSESVAAEVATWDIGGHLWSGGLVVIAYLWHKWTSPSGPPDVADLEDMHKKEKLFRKCLKKMREPLEEPKEPMYVLDDS